MASSVGGADAAEAVVVGVRGGERCRRAVRWAAEHLVPHVHRVVLVHVIPSVSSIPCPSGKLMPVERMERELVEMYVQDQKIKAQEVFLGFRKLCGTKNVETLVLDGENPAAALLQFVGEFGVKHLVLGSSSYSWIRRILKDPDVPTVVLKSAPSSCNVFVVSRRKLKIKFGREADIGPNGDSEIHMLSHKTFSQSKQIYMLNRDVSLDSLAGNGTAQMSACFDVQSYSQISRASSHSASADGYSGIYMGEPPAEVVKLRLELQKVLAMYNQTCGDLVRAKRKVESLSAECSESSKKVNEAMDREDILRQLAAEENAKRLEVIKEAEEARQLLAREALERHKAEIVAMQMSSEKSRAVDALFSNDKRCRRYSRNQIEVATDNFSDAKKIGKGSYGNVYKCNLDHTPVAIKVLRQDASDKTEEFIREVEVLSQLRHPHMLSLLGVCPENGCLVYEYMENGSLDDELFHKEGKQPLPWLIRFRIVFEVACGLAFLHGTKPEPIVHRDLKPGNILLDQNYVSKIGDVGLAKLISNVVPDGLTEYRETVLAGTLYYMDPEYQRTGTIRPKSDLYALGIISLQLLTGKHPRGLVISVENAIKGGSFRDVLDKSVADWPLVEAEKLANIALQCSRLRCRDRPDLETEILPGLEELLSTASISFKLRKSDVYAPSHYICPILQEIMDDPYIAGDGFTYEYRAIKAWLEKHKISPVTKLRLSHTQIIPNHSLRSAIQEWKSGPS